MTGEINGHYTIFLRVLLSLQWDLKSCLVVNGTYLVLKIIVFHCQNKVLQYVIGKKNVKCFIFLCSANFFCEIPD